MEVMVKLLMLSKITFTDTIYKTNYFGGTLLDMH